MWRLRESALLRYKLGSAVMAYVPLPLGRRGRAPIAPCLPANIMDAGRIVIWGTPSQRKGCRPASQSFEEPVLVILMNIITHEDSSYGRQRLATAPFTSRHKASGSRRLISKFIL